MPNVIAPWAPWRRVVALSLLELLVLPATVPAQEAKTGKTAVVETEAEKKERAGRRKCTVALCAVLHNGKPAEGVLTCSLRKSWRKEAIIKKLARGKVSWPWGGARCAAKIKVDRALLVKAMREPEFVAQFDTHDIRCQIEGEKETYDVTAQVRPEVTFKQGKATEARLNWGKIEAPTLAKTALWSIAAVDNTFGVLQGIAVEDINKFIDKKCMEVKEEWQGK